MKYKLEIVVATYEANGIVAPEFELRVCKARRWRFDLAWPEHKLFLEVQGGIWGAGRHSRGAGMKKDWEKWNTATCMGWRGLWCEPRDLCMSDMMNTIKEAIKWNQK